MSVNKVLATIIGGVISFVVWLILLFIAINVFCTLFPGICTAIAITTVVVFLVLMFFVIKWIKENMF